LSEQLEAAAPAKLNLALVVGPLRLDGKHEVVTVLERLALADEVALREADATAVEGFADDTLVGAALEGICAAAGSPRRFAVRLTKRIPVAAGLGGGSSDAAAALALANRALGPDALSARALHDLAADLGADVPFFLHDRPQLATGDGTTLEPLGLPRDYSVLLVLQEGDEKSSTREVYEAFDARDGASGFDDRRQALHATVTRIRSSRDLADLPANDLASSPLAAELRELGAFRADVSGAGPVVFGLFATDDDAHRAGEALMGQARIWVTTPLGRCP